MAATKVVWKYPLELVTEQKIRMPQEPKFLSVQMQNGRLCLWALVNPYNSVSEETIFLFGTGHPIDSKYMNNFSYDYISTIQLNNGSLVLHAFCYNKEFF